MIKNLNIFVLLLLSINCKAQSPIIDIIDDDGSEVNGAYYKDVNNLLNPFEGTYVYTSGSTTLKIVLVKKVLQYNSQYYEDLIIGEYQYKKYGVQIESWGPFAEGKNGLFTNEILKTIGEKYNKSVAQVVLRFLIQRDIIVIPKTVNKDRMIQNLDVFNFELSEEDMAKVATLDMKQSQFFSHQDPVMVDYLLKYKVD